MKVVAKAIAGGYEQIVQWRVDAFLKGWLRQHKVKVPVISIGNLTVGGTGKTPITAFLLQMFIQRGLRPGVVVRSYKTKSKVVNKVRPQEDRAEDVGDEPLLLAQKFSGIPVYSGPRKWEAAEELCKNETVNLVFLDDGFQHLHLFRNLDILLMDASEDPQNYECLPVGRARESIYSLHRAQIFFLTKCNQASEENLEFHRQRLEGKDVYEFDYKISYFEKLNGKEMFDLTPKKILLVSALAKPESFKKLVKETFPKADIDVIEYADHHFYKSSDVKDIAEQFTLSKYDVIFTTEKDGVKLKKLPECESLPIWKACLELKPRFDMEALYADISSYIS